MTPKLGINVLLDNARDQVEACVEIARRAGYDFLVLDQTRPDVEVAGGTGDRAGLAAFLPPPRSRPTL